MDDRGHVVMADSEQEAQDKLGTKTLCIEQIELSALTHDQRARLDDDEQPVVKPADHRSKLGRKRLEMERRLKSKKDRNRRRKKAAKAHKRKNRS